MDVPEEASDGTVASGKHDLIGDWLLSLETSAGKPSCRWHLLSCWSDLQCAPPATSLCSHVQQPQLAQDTGRQPTVLSAACRVGGCTVPVTQLPGKKQHQHLCSALPKVSGQAQHLSSEIPDQKQQQRLCPA